MKGVWTDNLLRYRLEVKQSGGEQLTRWVEGCFVVGSTQHRTPSPDGLRRKEWAAAEGQNEVTQAYNTRLLEEAQAKIFKVDRYTVVQRRAFLGTGLYLQ